MLVEQAQMLEFRPLRAAERLDLSRPDPARLAGLDLIYAAHRGSQLSVPSGWLSLWLPLRGKLLLESPSGRWTLQRELLIAHEGQLQASTDARALWLVLAGPHAAWRTLLNQVSPNNHCNELFVRQGPCPRDLRRRLVHLARIQRDGGDGSGHGIALRELCTHLLDQQRDLQGLVERCNGRTLQRRVLTLQRLLRVHQLIERGNDGHLNLTQVARSANYSPWHLIRMYRDVFGETPSEHIARLRLVRAWSLVCGSALPVCEITEKLGFESESAFCRAFKSAYGVTTTQVRRMPTAGLRQANPRPSHARPRTRPGPMPLSALR
jgi:AraC-like DNA-binding protein